MTEPTTSHFHGLRVLPQPQADDALYGCRRCDARFRDIASAIASDNCPTADPPVPPRPTYETPGHIEGDGYEVS